MLNGRDKKQTINCDYILVAGCSRAGAQIASNLSSMGKDVVVLDKDSASFRRLAPDYSGFSITADVSDIDALIHAGVEKADVFFAATDDDNVNIMASQMASRIFAVQKVIARLYDTDKQVLYKHYHVEIIYPTKLTTNEFEQLLFRKVAEEQP